MTSQFLNELLSYNILTGALTFSYFAKFIPVKILYISKLIPTFAKGVVGHFPDVGKGSKIRKSVFSLCLKLSARVSPLKIREIILSHEALHFAYISQIFSLLSLKAVNPTFCLSQFSLVSCVLLILFNILVVFMCKTISCRKGGVSKVIEVSIFLTISILLFGFVDNFLLLIFSVEFIGVLYFFFLLDPHASAVHHKVAYKTLVSLYTWNSFFILLLFSFFLLFVALSGGTLDFIELSILSNYCAPNAYGFLILFISWKVGAPGFHFFKFEVYTYLHQITLILFSCYTLFINFFILLFIIVNFKSILIVNEVLLLLYILLINAVLLAKCFSYNNFYTFCALSAANTWSLILVFGLYNCQDFYF